MDVNASQPRILSGNIWVKGGLFLLSSSYFSGIWSLLFYSLEQTNKDIFAAVHQRKAELAEIVDWTGLYETGCSYLFRVPHLLMDKYLLGNTWVLWQWISWQYDQHQQRGWSANLFVTWFQWKTFSHNWKVVWYRYISYHESSLQQGKVNLNMDEIDNNL